MASGVQFNPRMGYVPASGTLQLAARVRELRAKGERVLSLAAGEPDFDTPQPIKDAAIAALQRGETKYSPAAGYLELRRAICRKLKEENGLEYTPEQVVVSNGAKHSVFNALCVMAKEGDEVLLPAPYWLSYPPMVQMTGAELRVIETTERTEFKLTADGLRRALSSRSRLLILNSPANPTGAVYRRDELEALAEVAVEAGLWIISDEIYEKITYNGAAHTSIASLSEPVRRLTVVINGFSKTYAMTGWRLGYLAAEPEIARAVANLQSQSTSGPNSFAQFGALEALRLGPEVVERMVDAYRQRRALLLEVLAQSSRLSVFPPQGSFYCWVDIGGTGLAASEFAWRLLEEERTAVVPGESFGSARHIRVSFACSEETIREAGQRIVEFAERCVR